jgi:hypothetical protein
VYAAGEGVDEGEETPLAGELPWQAGKITSKTSITS